MISVHPDTKNIGKEWAYARRFMWSDESRLDDLAPIVRRNVWSPCKWDGGHRKTTNFISATLIGLDFDNGATTLEQALNIFADSAHIIGTTKSHQKEKGGRVCDRFRVVLKLSAPITDAETFKETMKHYVDRYDCDSQCKDAARFFNPCREIVSVLDDGFSQDVFTPKPVEHRLPARRYKEFGAVRLRTVSALAMPFPLNEYNHYCFMVSKDLYDAGWTGDEIYSAIVESPTYRGVRVSADLSDEIWGCIRSAMASVDSGVAYVGV